MRLHTSGYTTPCNNSWFAQLMAEITKCHWSLIAVNKIIPFFKCYSSDQDFEEVVYPIIKDNSFDIRTNALHLTYSYHYEKMIVKGLENVFVKICQYS